MDNLSVVELGLTSGVSLRVDAFFLYPQDKIIQARALQAQAVKNLGGVSTGLGFWGSPEWVIGGAIVLGVLEGIASSAAAKEGLRQLAEVERILRGARDEAEFVSVNKITNIDFPFPEKWACPAIKERETGLKLFGPKTEAVACPFIHDGTPFILVRTVSGEPVSVSLDKIETYRPIPAPIVVSPPVVEIAKLVGSSEAERRKACRACRGEDPGCPVCKVREDEIVKALTARKLG